jgi:O-antigen/teichoic acid export membrane protein
MGPQYAEKSYIILAVLLIPQIYSLSQFSTEEVLLGTARHRFFSVVVVVEALCNLILSIILIKPYGILGVAIGTSVPVVIFRVLFSPIFVKRITGYSFWKYLQESLLSPLALAIPIAIAAILLEKFLRAESLWEFFLQALLLILIYYLLAWRLEIEKSVKDSIRNRLKKLTANVG